MAIGWLALQALATGTVCAYTWNSSRGNLDYETGTNAAHTARPVVSIPSTYKLQWNSETNMYDIIERTVN